MRITGPLLIPRNRMRSGTGAASPYAGLMGVAVICGGLMACMGALIGLIKGKEYLDVRHLTNESAAHHAAANPQNKDKLRDIFNAVLKSGAIVHDMEGNPVTYWSSKYKKNYNSTFSGRDLLEWARDRNIDLELVSDYPYSVLRTDEKGGTLRLNAEFTTAQAADVVGFLLSQARQNERSQGNFRARQEYMTIQHNTITRLSPEPAPQ